MNPSDLGQDLASIRDIAKRSGYPVALVAKWTRRYPDFPAPIAELASGRVWLWSEVAIWMERRKS